MTGKKQGKGRTVKQKHIIKFQHKKQKQKTYQPNAKCGPCLDLDFKRIFFKI